ncbi:hypothetical protein IMZ31_24120 (plasmid) [Pontibacillus sp. ALD_SL1]|uniref:hypothetical protein n=1 Tax=Pontibacillus sp. ALD_SL1 TaxID=2777185 RepID=UPI001A97B1C3|nr:hypothetical protein [Pontibacillus sp. ALD_SL1]QST02539.1 hypothetical protein IMZ31_24120 [Pontibacillus sp. ALD_SL1]
MRAKEVVKVVSDTLEQLEKNATNCLEKNDKENAQMYLNYAEGVRMVLDNIEYKFNK